MIYGVVPANAFHLFGLAVPVLLWAIRIRIARRHRITISHNSSLAVAYWEEVLFRGVFWGVVLAIWGNPLTAAIVTSALFGLLHVRNLWWAGRGQVIQNCIIVTLTFAPLVSIIRWWSGDIYLGIAFHALWNFIGMYLFSDKHIPTDSYLQSRRQYMNWFEKLFSGLWLASGKK